MAEEQKSFKIVDRRLFNESGESRLETEENVTPSDNSVPRRGAQPIHAEAPRSTPSEQGRSAATAPASSPKSGPVPGNNSERKMDTAGSSAVGSSGSESPKAEVDFSSFVISLATQVVIHLGEIPHPESNQRVENFEAARQTIDILALLEEKTVGNLSQDESHLLKEALTSLRMAFVNKSK